MGEHPVTASENRAGRVGATMLGARVPSLRWLTIGLFGAAGLLILGSGALMFFGLRRRPAN